MKNRRKSLWLYFFVLGALELALVCSVYIVRWPLAMSARAQHYQELEAGIGDRERASSLMWEAVCFPVRNRGMFLSSKYLRKQPFEVLLYQGEDESAFPWYFEDGFGVARSYGGARKHEGIDIMSVDGVRGRLKVQSVSAGIVEQLGWLELGGYRVGIRAPSGRYYYYAHLDRYAKGLAKGDRVRPGTLLGYMGDTGYGKEGTRGQFAVHLHFGLYEGKGKAEKAFDPYFLLRYLEK